MQDEDARCAEVAQADQARRAAMLAGDVAALERLIAPDAIYIHTNGWRETGLEYLQSVRAQKYTYVGVELDRCTYRVYGNAVLVAGIQTLEAHLPGATTNRIVIQAVLVWEKRADNWAMVHYQGTNLPRD